MGLPKYHLLFLILGVTSFLLPHRAIGSKDSGGNPRISLSSASSSPRALHGILKGTTIPQSSFRTSFSASDRNKGTLLATEDGLAGISNRQRQVASISLTLDETWTDVTFSNWLCSQLNSNTVILAIYGNGTYLRIPSCVVSSGSALNSITFTEMHVEDFSYLVSPQVSSLILQRCHFAPATTPASPSPSTSTPPSSPASPSPSPSSSPTPTPSSAVVENGLDDGFFADGSVNWSEIFLHSQGALVEFEITDSDLFGPLPFGLPTVYDPVYTFRGNQLSGTIPSGLFQNIHQYGTSLSLDISNNRIEGTISPSLFSGIPTQGLFKSLSWFANGNRLSGSLPSGLLEPAIGRDLTRFELELSNNTLNGSLPSNFFDSGSIGGGAYVSLKFDHNRFVGTIPSTFFDSVTETKTLFANFSSNNFSGSLPAPFFSSGMSINDDGSGYLTLDMSNNALIGSIPANCFNTTQSVSTMTIDLNLSKNNLTGSVPSNLFSIISDLPMNINFAAASNQISGSHPSFATRGTISIDLSYNRLVGSIPSDWQTYTLDAITLAGNTNLSGSLPPDLFYSTAIAVFNVNGTSIRGNLPSFGVSMTTLVLGYTQIDFCSAISRSSFTSIDPNATCELSGTSACNCQASYSQCSFSCPGCLLSTRPSADFQCVAGRWTLFSTNATTVTIPAGAGSVLDSGDLTVSKVVLKDVSSKVQVSGCAANLASVEIELDSSEVERIGKSDVRRDLVVVAWPLYLD